MPDLSTRYLGLPLAGPLVASSSPLTGNLDDLRRLEDAGAAAVVLPSLFEEEVSHEATQLDRVLATGADSHGEASGYFPEPEVYDTAPDRYLELVHSAAEQLSIPVIASLNGTSPGGWLDHARAIEQAGATARELNLYAIVADPEQTAAAVEDRDLEIVARVRREVGIPVSVKLSPYFTALAHLARRLEAAGADGLTLFNRFYQPDLDVGSLEVVPRLTLSRSDELRLPLRWIAILHGRIGASLAASSGIHTCEDVLKALLAGADVAMLASALLERGPALLGELTRELSRWLEEREYASVTQLRGSVSQRAVADPSAFERGNYLKTLRSYASSFPS